MSGWESVAQVNRELASPKLKNLKRAGLGQARKELFGSKGRQLGGYHMRTAIRRLLFLCTARAQEVGRGTAASMLFRRNIHQTGE